MLHERLRDDPSEWGLTRIEYAHLEKRRLREREKKRRQRAMQARQERMLIVLEELDPMVTFLMPCGLTAYQVRGLDQVVSLPFVSILDRESGQ